MDKAPPVTVISVSKKLLEGSLRKKVILFVCPAISAVVSASSLILGGVVSDMVAKLAVTAMVATALSSLPSFTIKENTYVPAISVTKVGLTVEDEDSVAVELYGLEVRNHL